MQSIIAARLDQAFLKKALRIFLEQRSMNIPAPPIDRREDLTPEQIETAWLEWAASQHFPENALAELADMIHSYTQFKSVPKGFGPARQAGTLLQAQGTPERQEHYEPQGPMMRNRYGKMVRTDAGIGRPPPNLGFKR
jgi:hypothetical protein